MGHGVRFIAQVHYRVSDTTRNVDKRQIAEFAVGAIEPRCQLCGEFKNESRAFTRDLAEPRVSHFGDLTLCSCAHPRAARGLLVEQAHLAEELTLIQIGQYHFVAVFVLDHDFDRAFDDVVQDVRQITGMNHHGFRWNSPYTAITQEAINRRYVTQIFSCSLH